MTKRIWKLYKEVRRLRNKVKTLEAEFLMKRMTDTAKIHVMDDLIQQGYFRKVRDDQDVEIYEIKVVR